MSCSAIRVRPDKARNDERAFDPAPVDVAVETTAAWSRPERGCNDLEVASKGPIAMLG
jgi:hypothetical protein